MKSPLSRLRKTGRMLRRTLWRRLPRVRRTHGVHAAILPWKIGPEVGVKPVEAASPNGAGAIVDSAVLVVDDVQRPIQTEESEPTLAIAAPPELVPSPRPSVPAEPTLAKASSEASPDDPASHDELHVSSRAFAEFLSHPQ